MPELDGKGSVTFLIIRRTKIIFELVMLTLFCVVIITAVREFVTRPFITSGDSMVPTFQTNEYLVMDEVTYRYHAPVRGDVIIFRYPMDPSIFFIKRLIGLPGDTVTITNGIVSVQPQGSKVAQMLIEPYVDPANRKKENSVIVLGADEYFVLGDNRNASFDSRTWGPVPLRYIIGRPVARLFPPQRLSLLPGEYPYLIASTTTTLSTVKK